ncbi:MAG: EamA family transporter [Lactobacillus sp.]|jgi:drug/metabolite transporter (DMT)-like permease|nr:EamA family transporter [Lactobacillus sp.]
MANGMMIFVILMFTTLTGSIGALTLKQGMNKIEKLTIVKMLTNWWLIGGVLLYLISSIANIYLYKFLPYSIAFPMTSLTYVWTVIISYFTFKEKITPLKIVAVLLIIAGIVIIAR